MRPDSNEQKQKERPASSVLMLREIESKVQRHLSKQNAYSSSRINVSIQYSSKLIKTVTHKLYCISKIFFFQSIFSKRLACFRWFL